MTELRLYAIGIDEVRDMFGAAPEVASQLRTISQQIFPAPQRSRGLLGKIGPLFKRDYFPDDPQAPTPDDTEDLLAGRFISPERMPQAWRVFEAWLQHRAWGELKLPVGPQELEQLDLDLARAGVPAELGLCSCFRNDAQLPLRPGPGMRVGYAKHAHGLAMADGIKRSLTHVDERSAELARKAEGWLDDLDGWARQAATESRPAPDLLAVYLP